MSERILDIFSKEKDRLLIYYNPLDQITKISIVDRFGKSSNGIELSKTKLKKIIKALKEAENS